MKKFLLGFLFVSFVVNSQNIDFPDANFKAKLVSASASNNIATNAQGNYFKIDANSDGEIQQSEAVLVYSLGLTGGGITSIAGIEYFLELRYLGISGTSIGTNSLQGFLNLQTLNLENNQTTSISLANLPQLQSLTIQENSLSSFSGVLPSVGIMTFKSNNLTSLDLTGWTSLGLLEVGGNQLQALNLQNLTINTLNVAPDTPIDTIDLSGDMALHEVDLTYSEVKHLNLSGCSNLYIVELMGTSELETADFTGCTSLNILSTSQTALPALELHGLLSLQSVMGFHNLTTGSGPSSVHISNCPSLINFTNMMGIISDFSITGCPALTTLDLSDNEISGDMALPYFPVLHNISVDGNNLNSVDVSQCPSLTQFDASDNPLESVFAKNGSVETSFDVFTPDESTLKFICVDENQLASVQQQFDDPAWANVVISSYCTFTPGGTFNTISGQAKLDANGNGCDASDPAMPLLKVKIDDGSQVGYGFVDSDGGFSFYVGEGGHTLTPIFENPTYFNASPVSATVNFPAQDGTVSSQDFCISANGLHQDLDITFVPIGVARPGFEAFYQVVLRNKGNQSMSGNVTISFEENVLDFVEASETLIQNPGNLTWDFTGLQPFGSQVVGMMFNVNASTATPPVNINDILTFTAIASPLASDEMPQDNTFVLDQAVVGSYDPNNKQCVEGDVVSVQKIGEYLHYVLNFENTGTFPAENVVVADLIDTTKFDLSTFQLLSASHPNVTRITGNKVEFIFEGIDLGINEHGNVVFKIKTKNTLTTGSTVTNKANIFFDYNFPIETNLASTTFQNLQTGNFVHDVLVVVSPNPTSGMVRIKAGSDIHSVSVYDMQGRVVSTELPSANDFVFDMRRNQSGIYFLKVITAKGISVEKVMKK